MGTRLLVGLATCWLLTEALVGATRLQGSPPTRTTQVRRLYSPPTVAVPDEPTASCLLKPNYKVITELPKPKPGFYLNKQFQTKNVARTDGANIEAREKVFETDVGTFKLYKPRKPKPAFYLNRQFQERNKIVKEDGKKFPRKIMDDSGKYWTVAELPEPEAGYYLNRQFQRQRVFPVEDSSGKSDSANVEVFLLTRNTEALPVNVPITPLPLVTESPTIDFGHTATTGSSREVNFYTVFSVPDELRTSSPAGDRKPSPRPRPQQVLPPRKATSFSTSNGEEVVAQEVPATQNVFKMPDIRTGFVPSSAIAQVLQQGESTKIETKAQSVAAVQEQRQGYQTEQQQRQREREEQQRQREQQWREREEQQRQREQQRREREEQQRRREREEQQRRREQQRREREEQQRRREHQQRQRERQQRLREQQQRERAQKEQQQGEKTQTEQQQKPREQEQRLQQQRPRIEQQRPRAEQQRPRAEQQRPRAQQQRPRAQRQRPRAQQQREREEQQRQREQQQRERAQKEQQQTQETQTVQQQSQRVQIEPQQNQRVQIEPQQSQRVQIEPQQSQRTQTEPHESQRPQGRRQPQGTLEKQQEEPGFDCQGRDYGFYPDIESDCQGYYICNPVKMGGSRMQYHKYSFQCSPGMKWDQQSMACVTSSIAHSSCQSDDHGSSRLP